MMTGTVVRAMAPTSPIRANIQHLRKEARLAGLSAHEVARRLQSARIARSTVYRILDEPLDADYAPSWRHLELIAAAIGCEMVHVEDSVAEELAVYGHPDLRALCQLALTIGDLDRLRRLLERLRDMTTRERNAFWRFLGIEPDDEDTGR